MFYANVCKSDVYIFYTAADCLNHCVLWPFVVQKVMFCRLKDNVLYCKRACSAVRMIELLHENQWKTAGCCGNMTCILAVLSVSWRVFGYVFCRMSVEGVLMQEAQLLNFVSSEGVPSLFWHIVL